MLLYLRPTPRARTLCAVGYAVNIGCRCVSAALQSASETKELTNKAYAPALSFRKYIVGTVKMGKETSATKAKAKASPAPAGQRSVASMFGGATPKRAAPDSDVKPTAAPVAGARARRPLY